MNKKIKCDEQRKRWNGSEQYSDIEEALLYNGDSNNRHNLTGIQEVNYSPITERSGFQKPD